ncbi:hypothetical protein TNCV_2162381 [Trichonephila clavipes]|nr:hypothetical protein TNCV_2162381 [Trichonephila clavipes]
MPLRHFRRQYELIPQFEKGRIIGMMEAGWSARRVARQLGRSNCVVRRSHFRQDSAWPHTAKVSQDYIRTVTTHPWPAQSPDLSQSSISGIIWDGMKVSNHGSIPITIDCNVVAFIVFEEGFHQPIKRTKQRGGCIDLKGTILSLPYDKESGERNSAFAMVTPASQQFSGLSRGGCVLSLRNIVDKIR